MDTLTLIITLIGIETTILLAVLGGLFAYIGRVRSEVLAAIEAVRNEGQNTRDRVIMTEAKQQQFQDLLGPVFAKAVGDRFNH